MTTHKILFTITILLPLDFGTESNAHTTIFGTEIAMFAQTTKRVIYQENSNK